MSTSFITSRILLTALNSRCARSFIKISLSMIITSHYFIFVYWATYVVTTGTRVHNLTSLVRIFMRNKKLHHCLNNDGVVLTSYKMHRSSFSITGHINCIRLCLLDTACWPTNRVSTISRQQSPGPIECLKHVKYPNPCGNLTYRNDVVVLFLP